MIRITFSILFSLFLLLFSPFSVGKKIDNKCISNRAAFDIGSGTTRIKVARVDTCLQKVLMILEDQDEPVPYKESLSKSQNGVIDKNTVKLGLEAIEKLAAVVRRHRVTAIAGVGTSALREAKNGKAIAGLIALKLKTLTSLEAKIVPVTQKEEAILGFYGAVAYTKTPDTDVVVWDIGGGSMQIVSRGKDGKGFEIYEGELASVSMKNHIINEIQKSKLDTPNPMSQSDSQKAILHARSRAKRVSKLIQEKIKSGAEVLGIGGVHYYSLRNQSSEKLVYTRKQVERAMKKQIGKSDQELGGKYAATDVSNIALVLGYMKELKIEKVNALKVNMADGVLIHPKYW